MCVLLCMAYSPMMDVVSFSVGFHVIKIVSVSYSVKSYSFFAIISDSGYSRRALVGVLVELRFPFVL